MAVEITCDVEGIEEFKAAIQQFDSAMQRHVHTLLASWATDVKALAKQLAPVRTGHLKSSIYAKIQQWVAEIGAEATYALFVEFGTRHMQAQPYLYPAIQEHLPQLEAIICEAIDQAKAEAGLT
ncbi:HK97 gp10 family phage protein [Candidatus Bathyarchaeota archaeon A05DMB-2]|jgi:HK97 gp10 family phage protein|nr:HK97 gp10 family phage protein [Candidatus Bathyarchaeota archaeon A05DMB-2]